MKFEANLKKLETLVAKMEGGELNLDEMIKAFEEGRALVKTCQDDLESIRLKIEKVTKAGDRIRTRLRHGEVESVVAAK